MFLDALSWHLKGKHEQSLSHEILLTRLAKYGFVGGQSCDPWRNILRLKLIVEKRAVHNDRAISIIRF